MVKIISGDKSKAQTYCDLVKVSSQIEQAEPNSKADQLYQQMDELAAKRSRDGSLFAVWLGSYNRAASLARWRQRQLSTNIAVDHFTKAGQCR